MSLSVAHPHFRRPEAGIYQADKNNEAGSDSRDKEGNAFICFVVYTSCVPRNKTHIRRPHTGAYVRVQHGASQSPSAQRPARRRPPPGDGDQHGAAAAGEASRRGAVRLHGRAGVHQPHVHGRQEAARRRRGVGEEGRGPAARDHRVRPQGLRHGRHGPQRRRQVHVPGRARRAHRQPRRPRGARRRRDEPQPHQALLGLRHAGRPPVPHAHRLRDAHVRRRLPPRLLRLRLRQEAPRREPHRAARPHVLQEHVHRRRGHEGCVRRRAAARVDRRGHHPRAGAAVPGRADVGAGLDERAQRDREGARHRVRREHRGAHHPPAVLAHPAAAGPPHHPGARAAHVQRWAQGGDRAPRPHGAQGAQGGELHREPPRRHPGVRAVGVRRQGAGRVLPHRPQAAQAHRHLRARGAVHRVQHRPDADLGPRRRRRRRRLRSQPEEPALQVSVERRAPHAVPAPQAQGARGAPRQPQVHAGDRDGNADADEQRVHGERGRLPDADAPGGGPERDGRPRHGRQRAGPPGQVRQLVRRGGVGADAAQLHQHLAHAGAVPVEADGAHGDGVPDGHHVHQAQGQHAGDHQPPQLLHLHRLRLLLLLQRRRAGLHPGALHLHQGDLAQRLPRLRLRRRRDHHLPPFPPAPVGHLRRHRLVRAQAPRPVPLLPRHALRGPAVHQLLRRLHQLRRAKLHPGVRGGDRVHGALLPLLRLLPGQPQHPGGVEVDEHHLDDEVPVRGPADERVQRGPCLRVGARHRADPDGQRHPQAAGDQHGGGPKVVDGALPPRLGRLLPRPLLPRPTLRL